MLHNLTTMYLPTLLGGLAGIISGVYAQSNASQILVVDQKSFNVLNPVLPPSQENLTTESTISGGPTSP